MVTSILTSTVKNIPNDYFNQQCSHRNNKPLPLAPFGKEADLLLSFGVKPRNDIFVTAGLHAWQKAKAIKALQVVLCLPYGADVFAYTWPVRDCSVLLMDTGFLSVFDIEKIAYCLLCAGASVVRALLSDDSLVVYRRDTV